MIHYFINIFDISCTVFFFFLRENTVFLQIGYKSLSYELHEQTVAFGIEALFGKRPHLVQFSFSSY